MKKELKRMKTILQNKKKIDRKNLIYEENSHMYDFKQIETIGSFGDTIFNGTRRSWQKEIFDDYNYESINDFYKGKKLVFHTFKTRILEPTQGKISKYSSHKKHFRDFH